MPQRKQFIKSPALLHRVGESPLEAMARQDWRFQLCAATEPASGIGMIVRAVLGRGRHLLPRLGEQASINADGLMAVDFWDLGGTFHQNDTASLFTAESVRDNVRRLADHLKLKDADREALFTQLQKWMGADHREIEKPK